MAKNDKAEGLASTPRVAAKEVYRPAFNVPEGNPDRHILRVANRTWLVLQPGSSTFIGQFPTKDEAMLIAKRHVEITKGNIISHS